ncbi:elongation factor 1-beta [archaeon]|nr:elongation factor 1-beta [archaeon]|tara:strand:+ start:1750 stop:2025 length:276 start_codon:yes stop_codon:yes gene_type:complete
MATVLITLKIMPESPDVNLETLKTEIFTKIDAFGGKPNNAELVEVAFGLKAFQVMFSMDESIGATDDLEDDIATLDGVQSVDVTDVRRAFG